MAGRQTGASANSAKRFIVDSGAIYKNYGLADEDPMGATQEGATFTVEQTVREVPVDGFRGPMRGARRVTSEMARISASILEMTTDNLTEIITGSDVTDHTATGAAEKTHNQVQRTSDLPKDGDYLQNVALVGRVQGSDEPAVFILYDALSDGGLEMETSDESEGTVSVQFTAHFDPEDPDTSPWAIRFPSDVDEEGDS
jgi:hypothetical protein